MMPARSVIPFPGANYPSRSAAGEKTGGTPQPAPGHPTPFPARARADVTTTDPQRAPIRSPQQHMNAADDYRDSLRNILNALSMIGFGFIIVAIATAGMIAITAG